MLLSAHRPWLPQNSDFLGSSSPTSFPLTATILLDSRLTGFVRFASATDLWWNENRDDLTKCHVSGIKLLANWRVAQRRSVCCKQLLLSTVAPEEPVLSESTGSIFRSPPYQLHQNRFDDSRYVFLLLQQLSQSFISSVFGRLPRGTLSPQDSS